MSTIHTINKQTTPGDRRTTFTALVAESQPGQEPQPGTCLSGEDLAWLVDHPAAGTEQEQFFEHLAICDPCYRQWLELSEITVQEQDKGKVIPLFTTARLAWTGSFLAAAASVVLFLNIQQDTGIPVLKETGTAVQSSSRSQDLSDSMDNSYDHTLKVLPESENLFIEESMPAEAAAPQSALPLPAASPDRKEKKSFPEKTIRKKAETKAIQDEPVIQSMGMELQSRGTTRGGLLKSAPEPENTVAWLATTAAACSRVIQGENINRDFWQEQYLAGRKLLFADQEVRSSDQVKRIETRLFYLQLLAEDEQLLPICEAILNEPGTGKKE